MTRSVRWLLPWIAVLLVSATLTLAVARASASLSTVATPNVTATSTIASDPQMQDFCMRLHLQLGGDPCSKSVPPDH